MPGSLSSRLKIQCLSPEDKVEIIKQFIRRCGVDLSASIRTDQPERYAQNYSELITSYVEALQRTSSVFRRL